MVKMKTIQILLFWKIVRDNKSCWRQNFEEEVEILKINNCFLYAHKWAPKERGSTRTGLTEYLTGISWLIKNLFEPFTCLHGVPGNIDHTFSFLVLDYVGVPKREIVSMDLLQTRKKE